jgi:hypothetical protein
MAELEVKLSYMPAFAVADGKRAAVGSGAAIGGAD